MTKRTRISNKTIITVFEKKLGNLSATATALGVARKTLVRWSEADKELAEQMQDVRESLIDFLESKFFQAVSEGNIAAIIFGLKTLGKDRGYVERVENEVNINSFGRLIQELPDDEE